MKLEQVKCPVCGGAVDVDDNFETAKCPFCKSSFVIEDVKVTKKAKEPAIYDTKVIDVDHDLVQNELDIYSFFGWDFKHRKTHKVYAGQRRFKNGNYHDQYKDVVQITLQRNVKAKWCTSELMEKEKKFFELRSRLQANSDEHFNVFTEIKANTNPRNASLDTKYKVAMGLSFVLGFILLIVFCVEGSKAGNAKETGKGLVLFLLGFLSVIAGLVGMIVSYKVGKKKAVEAETKKIEEIKVEQARAREVNEKLEKEMLEIINWAGAQMEAKFGYKLAGKID